MDNWGRPVNNLGTTCQERPRWCQPSGETPSTTCVQQLVAPLRGVDDGPQPAGTTWHGDPMSAVALSHGVPVLRRGADHIQVGLDPQRSVVLSAEVAILLAACDGTKSASEVLDLVGMEYAPTLRLLLRNALVQETDAHAGAHDAVLRAHSLMARLPEADVRVFGGGRLGCTAAMLLAALGLSHVRVIDPRPVTAVDVTPWGANRIDVGVRRDHTCATLLERMHRGAQSHHARPGARLQPALDVIVLDQVADWPWFDATATRAQMVDDVAHIVVAQGGDTIAVTHVIEPGLTPCVGCQHQSATDVDPDWPQLCLQLATRHPIDTADLGLVLAAARQVVTVVATWLRREADVFGVTMLTAEGHSTFATWDRHPACGCAWDRGD